MDVEIPNRKLKRLIEKDVDRVKHFGPEMAKKIKIRIDTLRAAASLADFWPPKSGPERCHELAGNKKEIFSMDVKQPYRLLFTAIDDPKLEDNFQRWKEIAAVAIISIEDTHE